MATRQQEKERLRQHREQAEREAAVETRRRLVAGYFVAGLLAVAIVAAIVVVVANSGGGSSASESTFGTHYSGLDARRIQAGVTTMSTANSPTHIHPSLAVYVNGKQVTVPVNIGIDPAASPNEMAGLHTHDSKGTIHDEGMAAAKLGQFFAIWGVPFSRTELGSDKATGAKTVRMWVDGKPSQAYGDLVLKDGQQVVVSYGDKDSPPPPLG